MSGIDITEREEVERHLAHLASFPKLSNVPVLEVDLTGKITFFSPATLKTLERLGSPGITEAFVPKDLDAIIKVARKTGKSYFQREVQIGGVIFGESISFLSDLNVLRIYVTDITERKSTEEKLRITSENLELALQGADLGTWDWNVKTGAVRLDERWAEMLGYRLQEIEPYVGSLKNLVHPEDLPAVIKMMQTHLEGHSPSYETEHRLRHKSGDWVWVLEKGKVIERDDQGQPVRACGTQLDITARKKAEESLEEQAAFKTAIIDNTAEGLCVCHDINEFPYVRFTVWNQRMSAITGYSMEEINCQGWYQTVYPDPDIQARVMKRMAEMRQGNDLKGEEWEITCADGKKKVLRISTSILTSKPGETHVLALMLDVTERKRAEKQLYESEKNYRALFDNLNVAMAVDELLYDEQGCPIDWRIHDVNPAYLRTVSRTRADIIGRRLSEIFAINQAPELFLRRFAQVVQSGEPVQFEGYFEPLRIHGLVSAYYLGGSRFATLFMDITDRKRAEEEIKLNEARLASLLRISQHESESIQELLDFALDEAIALTQSKIGYIYFYDEVKQQFTLNTWSKEVMQECSIAEPQTTYQLEQTGIWGEAVRQARPIVVNDFQASHRLKKGYPQGHAQLDKYLTIPVCEGKRIVAVVGVANKATDYNKFDISQLTLMMDAVWKIAKHKRAEGEIVRQREELRGLAVRLAEVEELERQKLAEEIHDDVCQNLAAIGITLEILKQRAPQEPVDWWLSRLREASELVGRTGGIARDIMEGLRPTVLTHYGLMGGLIHLAEQFKKRTNISIEVMGEEAIPRLASDTELALFRIAQEALVNVVKHSQATKVQLSLEEDEATSRLTITDNGIGFDQSMAGRPMTGKTWGLMTIKERARAIGGTYSIDSQPGQGACITVRVSK